MEKGRNEEETDGQMEPMRNNGMEEGTEGRMGCSTDRQRDEREGGRAGGRLMKGEASGRPSLLTLVNIARG